jgi:hypothetical protein
MLEKRSVRCYGVGPLLIIPVILLLSPLVLQAQPSTSIPRIGVLAPSRPAPGSESRPRRIPPWPS